MSRKFIVNLDYSNNLTVSEHDVIEIYQYDPCCQLMIAKCQSKQGGTYTIPLSDPYFIEDTREEAIAKLRQYREGETQ